MNKNGLEIERKFLIEYPDCNFLLSLEKLRVLNMTQTYLLDDSRIRAIEENGETTYIKTVKKHITELVREEREWEISEEEYFSLLKNKKQGTNTIEKTRYAVEIGGTVYEIDVFGFWNDRAFLEIELEDASYETFGGYIMGILGTIPEDGSKLELETDRLHISILKIDEHRIEKTIVTKKETTEKDVIEEE
jgi:CYTH domain-containing protein